MAKMIFVNLPVRDLKKSMAFFSALGYTFNPQFTDENAACMVISEEIYVMLLVHDHFKTFVTRDIADTSKTVESIISLSADSRAEVDNLMARAVKAGATLTETRDMGWMYQRGFTDLDGHYWEYAYMDTSAISSKPGGA